MIVSDAGRSVRKAGDGHPTIQLLEQVVYMRYVDRCHPFDVHLFVRFRCLCRNTYYVYMYLYLYICCLFEIYRITFETLCP